MYQIFFNNNIISFTAREYWLEGACVKISYTQVIVRKFFGRSKWITGYAR